MTTAEILKAITDRSKFEKIGSDILRRKYPELKDLIEAGLNEKGESVRSPVDAFAPIKKDLYGYIEYTTDDSNLEKKWLKEDPKKPGNDGDLIKALRIVRQKRLTNPECAFQIFLVTNQRVSVELENKVQEKVPEKFIEVKTIELSNLEDFLDNDPVGQYLRWKHLGIRAVQLSQSLLREISRENLANYSQAIFTEESSLVDTSAVQKLSKQLEKLATKLALLVAPSGGGKSAASLSLAMKAYHAGEVVLRLEPGIIADSTGIFDAIERQLKRHYPDLFIGKDLLPQLLAGSPLIIIDDINSNNPGVLLDKIISWTQVAEPDNLKMVCPVWPQNIGLIKNSAAKENFYQTLKLNTINRQEGAEFIKQRLSRQGLSLSDSQIIEILNVTRQDPLLMTLYLDRIIKSGGFIANHGQQIIEWYVQENINDLSSKASLTTNRFVLVLDAIGYHMLSNRDLHPTYSSLRKYFRDTGRDFDSFEKLAVNRKLFHAEPDDSIVFRHDRIRDYLLIVSLQNLLPNAANYTSIIEDPYYSQWIGAAIAGQELSDLQIEQLLSLNPPAVFHSLKFLQGEKHQNYFDRIAGKINQWNAQIRTNNITQEVYRSAAFALLGFDTKDVMKITKGLPECLELYLARFRNGETTEGIRYYACQEWFPPRSFNYWRDIVLDHVLQLNFEKTLNDVESLLNQKLTDKGRSPTYLLAGYLRSPTLLPSLQKHWNSNKNENELHVYLWAILNCFNGENLSVLSDALDYWATLKVDPNRKYQSRGIKNDVVHELTGIRWEFTDEQINHLVMLSENPIYAQLIFAIINFLDSPAALGAVIKRLTNQGSPIEQEVFSDAAFDDDRWDVRRGRSKLSEPTRAFLFNHWKDKTNPEKERYRAFRYWCGNESDAIVLAELKSIPKEDTAIYEFSLNWRRSLRDMTVVPEYLQLAEKDLNYMLQADEIWNPDVKAYFKKFLAKTIPETNPVRIGAAIEVLRKINQADAEEILLEFWDNISWVSHGFIIALLIATPNTRQLAAGEINRLGFGHWDRVKDYYQGPLRGYFIIPDVPWNLTQEERTNARFMADEFRHIHFLFGNLVDPGNRQISLARLESLQPYFELMEDHGLSEIARQCRLSNYPEWVQKIASYLSKESKKNVLPTQDDIVEELRHLEISKQAFDFDQYLEKLSGRLIDRDQFAMCLAKFAQSANSFAGLIIICRSLAKMGTRKQIPIIENYVMTEEQYHDKAAPLKANTIYIILRNSLL